MYTKMLKETENEETRLFWQIFVIGDILIKGARVTSATPWLRQWFWDKIAALINFFIKKHLIKIKFFFPKRGGLESSHLTVF